MNRPTILVIDDEPQIQRLLEITLHTNGYIVSSALTAKTGKSIAASHQPDIVILDLGLPDQDGHEVLSDLRKWYTNPVIILSVKNNEEDIVRALDSGANDYLVKPFRTGELLARLRSVLRTALPVDNSTNLTNGFLEIDLEARVVKRNNEVVKVTATEYSLLALMAKNEGKVLTHQFLLKEIWGPTYIDQSQYLRVFIAQIRKKIERDPNRPEMIVTASGVGYRFILKTE